MARFRFVLGLAILTAAGAPVAAQAPGSARPPENATVLTTLDGQQIRAEMRQMSAALGVDCEHCHVQGNFASDEKRPKRMARWMLELTRDLNARQFPKYTPRAGESTLGRVTCFTCHRGSVEPPTAPPR